MFRVNRAALRAVKGFSANRRVVGPLTSVSSSRAFSIASCDDNNSVDSSSVDSAVSFVVDNADNLTNVVATTPPELGFSPPHLVISAIEGLHSLSGLPYWGSILVGTVILRMCLLPLTISAQRNSSALAYVRPEMERIQEIFKNDPHQGDARVRNRYQADMKALFKKYDCNPLRSLGMPLLQVPIFMSFFFGLREMSEIIPGMKTGGAFWFTDLSAADSTYILPVANALSFLVMLEISTNSTIASKQRDMLKNVMRVFSVALIPMTMSMPQAIFMYWSANSTFSILQTLALKHPELKKRFKILDPPVDTKPASGEDPMAKFMNVSFNLFHSFFPLIIISLI